MWKRFAVTAVMLLFGGCASPEVVEVPPSPPQPTAMYADAQSVDSGFLLEPEVTTDLQKRAEAGDPDAAFRLHFHFMSSGDQNQADHWRLIAAQHGHPVAQYNLWFALKDKRDCLGMEEAFSWLQAAADGGSEEAKAALNEYAKELQSCTP